MSLKDVSQLMDLWAASLLTYGATPPFANADDLLEVIDSIKHGDAPWSCFTVQYDGDLPAEGPVPTWMTKTYTVWARDIRTVIHAMLGNTDFNGELDMIPYLELNEEGKQRLTNFFSGNWAWRQAVKDVFSQST